MKVTLVAGVNPELETTGGIRTYVMGVGAQLARKGWDVEVIGAGPEGELQFGHFVSVTRSYPLSSYRFNIALSRWRRRNRRLRTDILHGQRPDELYSITRTGNHVPTICTMHGDPFRNVSRRRLFGRYVYLYAERKALTRARRIIFVSQSGLDAYAARDVTLQKKSCVIPVGIDLHLFRPVDREVTRQHYGIGSGLILLYAGRLEAEKRVSTVLDALRSFEDPPRLLIAGGGRSESELKRLALGLPVRFLGHTPHAEMPYLLSSADALVMASEFEGLPTIALESLACGTPVISTRVGDISDVVKDGRTGFFYDGTAVGLRDVVKSQSSHLPEMRESCVRAANRYGIEHITDRIAEVYHEAL